MCEFKADIPVGSSELFLGGPAGDADNSAKASRLSRTT